MGRQKTVSDDTAQAIDSEIRTIIDRNYQRAVVMLRENEDKLHLMADALMKYETIDSGQIDSIMEGKVPGPPKDWGDDEKNSSGKGGTISKDSKADDDTDMLDPAKLH
jgi:cell division protease FtsH